MEAYYLCQGSGHFSQEFNITVTGRKDGRKNGVPPLEPAVCNTDPSHHLQLIIQPLEQEKIKDALMQLPWNRELLQVEERTPPDQGVSGGTTACRYNNYNRGER